MYTFRFQKSIQSRDVNWEVITIGYIFKVMIMDEIIKGLSAYRDKKSKD